MSDEKELKEKIRNCEAKIQAIKKLVDEWESQIPVYFYLVINSILNNR